MILQQLKISFDKYALLWDLWRTCYDVNGLTVIDVRIIEAYRENDFYLNETSLKGFYRDLEIMNYLLSPISKKLDENYIFYMKWVIKIFHFYLISLVRETGIDHVSDIRQLKIDEAIKNKLINFGVQTLDDLMEYTGEAFQSPDVFREVLDFKCEILNYEKTRLLSQSAVASVSSAFNKKEVK